MEVKITLENFDEEVLHSDIPVIVDFYADWCGPCKMLAPELEAVAAELDGKVKIGKINVDEQGELANAFCISSFPVDSQLLHPDFHLHLLSKQLFSGHQ